MSGRFTLWLGAAFVLLLLVAAWSFSVGRFPVSPSDVWRALWASITGGTSGLSANVEAVVLGVRAPRVVAALGVGAERGDRKSTRLNSSHRL